MVTLKGKRVLTSLYLDQKTSEELKLLSKSTGVPQAVHLREAVELLLSHYRNFEDLLTGKKPPRPIASPPVLERAIRGAEKLSGQGRSKKRSE